MYDPCRGCGGEDCVCCEVWLERQADARSQSTFGPDDYMDMLDEQLDRDEVFDDDYGEDMPYDDSREDCGDWGFDALHEE